jgi:hypothetical protein
MMLASHLMGIKYFLVDESYRGDKNSYHLKTWGKRMGSTGLGHKTPYVL